METIPINKVLNGDALTHLKELPSESINCVMTSPPYWALRDYQIEGQLGLEPTFQEYIAKLCDIFDEVKRVLRKDGTCWVNMGDTYASSPAGNKEIKFDGDGVYGRLMERHTANGTMNVTPKPKDYGLSDKSLCNIPARFSIEMQNRGWILRNVIIWHKPNCMPSSVKDRFTVDFEYLFFFVKNKRYWFETQYEKAAESTMNDPRFNNDNYNPQEIKIYDTNYQQSPAEIRKNVFSNPLLMEKRNKRAVWVVTTKPFSEAHFATYPEELCETPLKAGCPVNGIVLDPFSGAGTTGLVALKQNKKFICIELNPEYIKIANRRLKPYLEQEKLI